MTEHVHEWRYECGIEAYICTGCMEELPPWNAEARLNATERLSAKEARAIVREDLTDYMCMLLLEHEVEATYERSRPLQAYADTLEGKDG